MVFDAARRMRAASSATSSAYVRASPADSKRGRRTLLDALHDPATYVEKRAAAPDATSTRRRTQVRSVGDVLVATVAAPHWSDIKPGVELLSAALRKAKFAVLDLRAPSAVPSTCAATGSATTEGHVRVAEQDASSRTQAAGRRCTEPERVIAVGRIGRWW